MPAVWPRSTWFASTARASPALSASPSPVLGRQRRPAAPLLAPVDDVVVDEERVVQQLDRNRDRKRVGCRRPRTRGSVATQRAGRSALPGRLG